MIPGVNERELPSDEVARRCGVSYGQLMGWRARGWLKLAPTERSQGLPLMWSQPAYAEARAMAETRRKGIVVKMPAKEPPLYGVDALSTRPAPPAAAPKRRPMGWLCPNCDKAHSPYVKTCPEQVG